MYVKPKLEVFGSLRELTLVGIDMGAGDPITGLAEPLAESRSGVIFTQ
jgi:hypothetical protein